MTRLCLAICTVRTISRVVSSFTARVASSFGACSLLLLQGSSLDRFVGCLSFLVVWVVLLHHVGARGTLASFLRSILSPSFLLNIKRCYQVFNWYFMSLVFQSSGKIPSREGNFAIMHPATNLSGKGHFRSSSSLTRTCTS